MSKINYAIISAEDYLRDLAKRKMTEDHNQFQSLISSRSSESDLECFQFRVGNVLEIKGERLVCDLFDEESFNEVSGMNLWGYITHMFGTGLLLVDLFYLGIAEDTVVKLADELLPSTVSYDFDASGTNCEMLGEMQITVEFDSDNNKWEGLDEVENFLQEFPRIIKSNESVKKVINKFLVNNE